MLTPNRLVARKRISTPPRPSSLRLETLEDRIAPAVVGQLRIVDYNILNLPNSSAMTTVLQEIGNQSFTSNGTPIQRPIDVLLLQEVDSSIGGQAAQVRDLLNGLYGAGAYSLGTLQQSQASGGDRQAIVYRNSTVNLLGELEVTGASGPRAPMRYRLEADVAPGLDFYIYNSHYDAVDAPDRLSEANAIRANANALGNGVDILYVGDYNIDSSNEDMYDVALLGAGNGQAFDPINTPGTWHNASGFKAVHTQSTRVAVLPDGGASGGMDDRFDFILHTQEVGASGTASNGLGLEYRSGAYRAYGNNNTHTFNGDINSGSGFPAGLLDALRLASDHLPIVVDYDIVTPGGDTTPPTLLSMDDGDADNTVAVNATMTYTVTFSEDILNGSFTAADLNNAGTSTITVGTITETSNGVFSVQVTPTSAGTVLLRIPTGSVVEDVAGNDLVVPVQDNDTVTVTAPTTLQVTALTPHSNGFSATFNQVVNPADVNLYTQTGSPVGGPDVTLIGDGTDNTFGTADDVNVRGTLLFAAGNTQIRFLATGPVNSTGTAGTLAPDTYRVTLLSSSLAFKNGAGDLLDGDANGTAGGDYVGSFTVTAPTAGTVTVSLPDFARGPGQPASGTTIRIPANPSAGSQGLPLTLSEGFNVRELSLQLVWDPALLTLTSGGYVANAGSATFTVTGPGQGTLTQTAATQFSSTASQPFVAGWFTATIPTTAGYSSKNLLDLTVTSISDANLQPRPFRDDDAVHLVAYQGDTDGNGILNSADSIALQRVIVNYTTNTTGFEAYQNADPRVLADFNLDSVLNAGDAIALTVEVVGDSPLIEPRPAPLPPLQPGGPDPRLFIPDGIQVRAGQRSVLVPVRVENTNSTPISIATARIAVAYDPNVFVFRGATAGSVGDGSLGGSPFTVLADESSPGTLLLNGFTTTGPTLAVGQTETIFWLRFDVRRDAPSGTTDLNILDLAGTTALTNNEGQTLTLIPQPTDGIDVDDGSAIVRRGKQARRLERRGGSMRRR